jgi:hypothetical protein
MARKNELRHQRLRWPCVAEVILCDVGEAALLSHICRFDQKP